MAREKICGIYCIRNIVNDKRYISGELIPLTNGMKKSDETKRKISESVA